MPGLFGGLFDFNHDGRMSSFEKAVEFFVFDELTKEERATEFELSGLDADELEFMDSDERREVLEAAGLDPDNYDF